MKILNDFTSKIIEDNSILISREKFLKGAIKIEEFLIFKSNKIISREKDKLDKLLFFDLNSRKFLDNINIQGEYSFIFSPEGILKLPVEKGELKNKSKNKIILFACKKYIKSQKNGIFLINYGNNIQNLNYHFYDTKNFEVYCFCPLILIESIKITDKKRKINDTEFFLVGGFELNKHKGVIKLYKINYSENTIEYIEDIIFDDDNYKRFRGPISCITQSSFDGKLLISCWDGNIYLFDSPKINNYKKYNDIILFDNKKKF